MKIYSYLASGKPVLATDLPTHTQVLDEESAALVEPTAEGLAAGLRRLAGDESLRRRIGKTGQKLASEKYSREQFARSVKDLFDAVEHSVGITPVAQH